MILCNYKLGYFKIGLVELEDCMVKITHLVFVMLVCDDPHTCK